MSDVELIIKIPETSKDIADKIDVKTFSHLIWQSVLVDAIKNGISLPKGHGRLIDADVLKTAFPCGESVRTECVRATIDYAPTIIEEDEGSEVEE